MSIPCGGSWLPIWRPLNGPILKKVLKSSILNASENSQKVKTGEAFINRKQENIKTGKEYFSGLRTYSSVFLWYCPRLYPKYCSSQYTCFQKMFIKKTNFPLSKNGPNFELKIRNND